MKTATYKMQYINAICFIVLLVFQVLGCGTTTAIHSNNNPASAKTPKLVFKTLVLEVKTVVPESDEEARLLDRFLSTEFMLKRKQLVDTNGDVQVVAVITRLEKVSQTSRLWWGSLAGSARLRVDVTVTGWGSGVMNFTLDTEAQGAASTGDWWSGLGGSTEDMLQRSAVKIVSEIL